MGFPNEEVARNSPASLMGTVDEVKRELRSRIDDFGLTFFTVALFGQETYEMFVNEVMPEFAG
jgi:alkanesulfonate monooxygenase SsuD/methylene tetrahydromethanopterin reductase-like flavin-dependent oxidoreductase (luciferase family)